MRLIDADALFREMEKAHWYERYVSAIRTFNELSGMNMKPQEIDG